VIPTEDASPRPRLSAPALALLILAGLIRIHYLAYTPPDVRTHDVEGHLDYLDLVARTGSLPHWGDCVECYHPPLYYLVALPFKMAFSSPVVLQVLSLAFFMVFLVFGALLIESLSLDPGLRLAVQALLCFWPAGILHAVRIGNDSLFYALYGAAFYQLFRWIQTRNRRCLLWAAALSAATLLVKANGIILYGLLLSQLAVEWSRSRSRETLRPWRLPLNVLAVGLLLLGAWTLYNRRMVTTSNYLVGNMEVLTRSLTVRTDLETLAFFDAAKFLQYPDIGFASDDRGREYFWNFALKTSLLGSFPVDDPLHRRLSIGLSALFLVLALPFAAGAREMFRRHADFFPLFLANLLLSFLALMFLRIAKPVCCSNDFRYILPSLLSSCAFLAFGTRTGTPALNRFAALTLAAFLSLSLLYFLVPS